MTWQINILEIFKDIASATSDYATVILVIITAIYAYFTYKMAKIMARQVIADIQVSNIILGSNFAEKWFRDRLSSQPEQINKDSYFKFNLLFDVRNQSSGNGSVDKPTLVLKFTDDGAEYEMLPITKDREWEQISSNTSREIVTDLGGTIFLRGGESHKIELEYTLYNFGDDVLKHIKENLNSLEYYIKFKDNLGKNYLLKITEIKGEREVYRK